MRTFLSVQILILPLFVLSAMVGRAQFGCDPELRTTNQNHKDEIVRGQILSLPFERMENRRVAIIEKINVIMYPANGYLGMDSLPHPVDSLFDATGAESFRVPKSIDAFVNVRNIYVEAGGEILLDEGVVGNMRQLEFLQLQGTVTARSLPNDLSNCEQLTEVVLVGDVQFDTLPSVLFALPKLEYLVVDIHKFQHRKMYKSIVNLSKKNPNLTAVGVYNRHPIGMRRFAKRLKEQGVCVWNYDAKEGSSKRN